MPDNTTETPEATIGKLARLISPMAFGRTSALGHQEFAEEDRWKVGQIVRHGIGSEWELIEHIGGDEDDWRAKCIKTHPGGGGVTGFRRTFHREYMDRSFTVVATPTPEQPEEPTCSNPRCGESFPGQITLKHDGADIWTAPCPDCSTQESGGEEETQRWRVEIRDGEITHTQTEDGHWVEFAEHRRDLRKVEAERDSRLTKEAVREKLLANWDAAGSPVDEAAAHIAHGLPGGHAGWRGRTRGAIEIALSVAAFGDDQ